MASNDLRDVLNISSDHSAAPRPSKKQRTGGPRPNLKGLAREVQNLGGDNPIAIVPDVSFFKKRRFASRKPAARWELRAFKNSAREDDGSLVLRHWKRKTDHGPPPPPEATQDVESRPTEDGMGGEKKEARLEDSSFAKFNVRVPVPQYNEDQYRSNLQSSEWTKEETDYLLELAKEYDLRWAIIWDRYEFAPRPSPEEEANGTSTAVVSAQKPRTMEDLKARYYEVAAKMMAVQKPAQYMTRPEFELYETMQNFNPDQERKRKEFALNTMARSKDEAREEESLLLEIKRILARTERFNEERRELYNRLDYPATDSDINSFKSSAGLQALLQNLMTTDKSKKRKSILGPGDGVSPGGAPPGSAVSESGPHHRRESIAAAVSSSRRDSDARGPAASAEPTPTTATSTTSASAHKKKGSTTTAVLERRKLSAHEEQVYGVTYHDRLGSGPTFRYERINKLYSHKSGQQQLRMTNALAELDVPPRLVMPTAAVTAQFEVLWSSVAALVDMRKMSDKLEGEIKLEEAKKMERERARMVLGDGEEGSGRGGGRGRTAAV
jgi:DNA methyltransferase 1-associated protein 1